MQNYCTIVELKIGLPSILHAIVEENKGKEFVFGGFKSSFLVDTKDVEVSPLHMIFNLKGVLVGKEYSRVNHFLPLPFNLAWGPTLVGKNVVPKLTLKQFLLRCFEQFIVYIWTSILLVNMHAYLKKIVEKMSIEIDLQRIMGQDLCKINKHFLQFPIKSSHYCVDCLTNDK